MKKIPSLFKRDYGGTRLIYPEVVAGCEWVQQGKGVASIKLDGTCCLVQGGQLYKRYDRKPRQKNRNGYRIGDFKPAPPGWMPAEAEPDIHSGHWPGWLPVGCGPEDRWHREAFANMLVDDTYELLGPAVQGNPYGLSGHILVQHGKILRYPPTGFEELKTYLSEHPEIEGIVWHHYGDKSRMVKIKRRDFGLHWPTPEAKEWGFHFPLNLEAPHIGTLTTEYQSTEESYATGQ